jgi:3-hydroxyisobutyrate dehydrogenase-like beta-hydroxyacid dehydrogenase
MAGNTVVTETAGFTGLGLMGHGMAKNMVVAGDTF